MRALVAIIWFAFLGCCVAAAERGTAYFGIQVVDGQTGRGVPLVELETVNHIVHFTDSNGWVAFNEPGLMGRKVFFYVRSDGYEFPKDGFGYAGVALHTEPGGRTQIKLKRVKQWSQNFDSTMEPLAKHLDRLHTVLANSLPQALASLAQTIQTLSDYAHTPAPEAVAEAAPAAGNQSANAGTEPVVQAVATSPQVEARDLSKGGRR